MRTDADRLLDRPIVLLALCILMTVPLWLPAIPPLTDLPGHMGRYRIMTAGAEAPALARGYLFHWQLIGNLGVDLLMVPLAHLFGVELATKLSVIAVVAGTAAAMLALAREAHGHIPATALFALPLIYSYPFQFGFVNFALATMLLFAALALWLRLGRQGRLGLRFALFIPIGGLVWLAHTLGFGLLGLTCFASEVARRRQAAQRWGPALIGAVVACLPLALPLVGDLFGYGDVGETAGWFRFHQKIGWIEGVLHENRRGVDIGSAAILVVLCGAALVVRSFRGAPVLVAAAAICIVAFIVMPFLVRSSAFADMRIAPVAAILAVLAIDVRATAPRLARTMTLAGALFLAVRLAGTTGHFAALDHRWRAELAAIDHLPRGASVLVLIARPCLGLWETPRLDHLGAIATVRRDAFTNTQFAGKGAQLLTVERSDVGLYHRNPSQILLPTSCPANRFTTVAEVEPALAGFNRAAFGYVWTIGLPVTRRRAGLTTIWSNATSALYRVTGPADRSASRVWQVSGEY